MTSERVIDAVLAAWNRRFDDCVTPAMVKSRTRLMNVAACRHICIYIMRKMTQRTIISIGQVFGRDHSTVVHSCSVIQSRVDRGDIEASIIHEAMMLLKDEADPMRNEQVETEAAMGVVQLYHKERRRADALEVALMGMRSKNNDLRSTISSLRAELVKLRQLRDESEYIKPMNWTKEERKNLKRWREDGGDRVSGHGCARGGSMAVCRSSNKISEKG